MPAIRDLHGEVRRCDHSGVEWEGQVRDEIIAYCLDCGEILNVRPADGA